MLVLKLTMLEGRSAEQKQALVERLTAAAAEYFDEPAEDIRIIIYEVPLANWGAGGVTIEASRSKT
jgi:4-oxalocrotonate tautomerase